MIVGIIQARMQSTRLPGKVMLNVKNIPLLELMIKRVSKSTKLEKIIVATSTNHADDIIEELCLKLNIDCFRGSEDDVLLRFKESAELLNANTIVRLCGDCPLIDSDIIDDVISEYQRGDYDFVSNLFPSPSTYPDGTSVEVFSSELLLEMENNAKKPSEREHVTFYIWMQPEKYKIHRLDYKEDLSKFRFNLDYKEDFEFIKTIFENFLDKDEYFTMNDIIEWLKNNEKVVKINSHIIPKLGWEKSFEKDKELGF